MFFPLRILRWVVVMPAALFDNETLNITDIRVGEPLDVRLTIDLH